MTDYLCYDFIRAIRDFRYAAKSNAYYELGFLIMRTAVEKSGKIDFSVVLRIPEVNDIS